MRCAVPFVPAILIAMLLPISCGPAAGPLEKPKVVVYTALDQMYSESIFRLFEQQTGIDVRAVYDTEATKTVGLVARLVAEAESPRCDVFWNNEIVRTIDLKRKGILTPYVSEETKRYPPWTQDPEGYWSGFAGRARIIVYNTAGIDDPSQVTPSIWALTEGRWKGRTVIARPLFGTTSTHAAYLFAKYGPEVARAYFEALKTNDVLVASGNASARDMVAAGQAVFGLTDTDDANSAMEDGRPIDIIFPDSERDKTLVIPNTVALVRGGPNPTEGKALIDFLLSRDVEMRLANSRSAQIPLALDVRGVGKLPPLSELPAEEVDWEAVADQLESAMYYLENAFLQE